MVAARGLRDRANPRRLTTALFWALLGLMFLAADRLPAPAVGALVVALAGFGGLGRGRYDETTPQEREAEARRWATACSGRRC